MHSCSNNNNDDNNNNNNILPITYNCNTKAVFCLFCFSFLYMVDDGVIIDQRLVSPLVHWFLSHWKCPLSGYELIFLPLVLHKAILPVSLWVKQTITMTTWASCGYRNQIMKTKYRNKRQRNKRPSSVVVFLEGND